MNLDKLNQFLGQMVGELGAAMNAALVLVGEKLGLYKAMAGAGPMYARGASQNSTPTNDTFANGSRRKRPAVTLPTILGEQVSRCRMNRPSRSPWRIRPRICRALSTLSAPS